MRKMSHRRRRKLRKLASRVAIAPAVITFAAVITNFAYTAYQKSTCYEDNTYNLFGWAMPTVAVDSDGCYALILASDKKMKRDAELAMLAIAVLLGASVLQSRAHRRTKHGAVSSGGGVCRNGHLHHTLACF